MTLPWERTAPRPPDAVPLVTTFCDRPRQGVAVIDGALWVFEAVFDDAEDDYADIYLLAPLPASLHAAVEDLCRYTYRWYVSSWYGLVPLGPTSTLPEDDVAAGRLRASVEAMLRIDRRDACVAMVEFVPCSAPDQGGWGRATWTFLPFPRDELRYVDRAWRMQSR